MSHSLRARVHGALWHQTEPERLRIWKEAIEAFDQLEGGDLPAWQLEVLQPPGAWFTIRLLDDTGERIRSWSLDASLWEPRLQEYAKTIEQLALADREAPIRGWEALDYAKRMVHDESAWALREELTPDVTLDIDAARALFTLFFLVAFPLPVRLWGRHRTHGVG